MNGDPGENLSLLDSKRIYDVPRTSLRKETSFNRASQTGAIHRSLREKPRVPEKPEFIPVSPQSWRSVSNTPLSSRKADQIQTFKQVEGDHEVISSDEGSKSEEKSFLLDRKDYKGLKGKASKERSSEKKDEVTNFPDQGAEARFKTLNSLERYYFIEEATALWNYQSMTPLGPEICEYEQRGRLAAQSYYVNRVFSETPSLMKPLIPPLKIAGGKCECEKRRPDAEASRERIGQLLGSSERENSNPERNKWWKFWKRKGPPAKGDEQK